MAIYINMANTWPKIYDQQYVAGKKPGYTVLFRSGATYYVAPDATADSIVHPLAATKGPLNVAYNLLASANTEQLTGRILTRWGEPMRLQNLPIGCQRHIQKLKTLQYAKP